MTRLTDRQAALALAAVLVVEILVFAPILTTAGPVDNTTADYYNNTSSFVANDSWLDGREDPTLDNTTNYITRVMTFVIGTESDGSGGVAR